MATRITTTNTPVVADSLEVAGAAGQGYIKLPAQTSAPAGVAGVATLWAGTTGELSLGVGARRVELSTGSLTAARSQSFPDASGEVVLTTNPATLEQKTIIGGSAGNVVDANKLYGYELTGSPADGDVLSFNTTTTQLAPLTISAPQVLPCCAPWVPRPAHHGSAKKRSATIQSM
jgi:hypothetical protein